VKTRLNGNGLTRETEGWLEGCLSNVLLILFYFFPPNVLSSHRRNKPNVHCTYFTQCYSVHQISLTQCHTQCPSPNVIPNVLHPMSYPMSYPMSFTQCHTQCRSPNVIPNVLHPMYSTANYAIHPMSFIVLFFVPFVA
jgi:hypothetical protein